MKRHLSRLSILASLIVILLACSTLQAQDQSTEIKSAITGLLEEIRKEAPPKNGFDGIVPTGTEIRRVEIDGNEVRLIFNPPLGYKSWTPETRDGFRERLSKALEGKLQDNAAIKVLIQYDSRGGEILRDFDEHVTTPETIRKRNEARKIPAPKLAAPLVDHVQYAGPARTNGLANRYLVMGPSHGWTWHKENRWQFQRARVYTIVEDLLPISFVNPFLMPMLENAGATVFATRERDYQTAEVIVDNDGVSNLSSFTTEGDWTASGAKGWKGPRPAMLDEMTEPFTLGTTLRATAKPDDAGTTIGAHYLPYIPKQGQYAVYASWSHAPENSPSVPIVIRHLGGETTVRVNEQAGGSTWIFLGFYRFEKGVDFSHGSVSIMASGAAEGIVTADAVRFGGGMGNVAPMDTISGKPRYAEGARYFLQYAGAPAKLVYYISKFESEAHFGTDYWTDIASRGEWANYLHGAPDGPNVDRENPGLKVPIDLFFAWHTDAGFDQKGLIGTLAIYYLRGDDGKDTFPDGRSRWLNRDLASLIQDEVVRTARVSYTSTWAKRALMDRNLGEARRANMPSMLLESWSHHNFNDNKYGNDPRFRRDIARAAYKAILRFVAAENGFDPIVEPLEPTHLVARQAGDGKAVVTWREQPDPLEPTAVAKGYIVYRSMDGTAFDNGTFVASPVCNLEGLKSDKSYFFRVTAVNEGGESLPSRVVGLRWMPGKKPLLIVDGFDRISGAKIIHEKNAQGFDRNDDPGVGYHYNYGLVGDQYDFDPESKWANDLETPGMGASLSNMENAMELGNTFDHVVAHGAALAKLGYGFDSMTSDAFEAADGGVDYRAVDWVAGRQRTIMPFEGMEGNQGEPDRMRPQFQVLPKNTRDRLTSYIKDGGKVFLSGAYIVEDLTTGGLANDDSITFASDVLGVEFFKARATSANEVSVIEGNENFKGVEPFRFGRDLEPEINILPTVYKVNSAESFLPTKKGFNALLEYSDTQQVACMGNSSVVLAGFPLETVMPPVRRAEVLGAALKQVGVTP
ncbi:N-acetylmuramoyl-L-alanine amidase [Candidatus Sumerlaeota bacterium]|nr:N-acetylmuramoyl-L-alanine amidase [Candidatus Sumerlaeota bacterium]